MMEVIQTCEDLQKTPDLKLQQQKANPIEIGQAILGALTQISISKIAQGQPTTFHKNENL